MTILLLQVTHEQEVKLQKINNPILPFSLGQARTTNFYHTFIHYINITELDIATTTLNKHLNKFNETFCQFALNGLSPIFNHVIRHLTDHAKHLTDEARNKLTNIQPNIRTKRGLLNVVGKVQKWLFGTLDSSDGEYYDKAIQTLINNQKTINHEMTKQLTLTKTFTQKFQNTLSKLNKNQIDIRERLQTISRKMGIDHNMMMLQNTIDLIILTHIDLISLLDNIENAILFARLHTLHTSIISVKTMSNFVNELIELYGSNTFPKFNNIQSYYEFATAQVFYRENKIIFSIHFPLLNPAIYNLFHIFPIPNKNLTLIPKKPYLLANSTHYYYEEVNCPKVENTCVYHINRQPEVNDCIAQMLIGNEKSCPLTPTYVDESITEIIDEAHLIIIPTKSTTVRKICHDVGIQEITQPHLVIIPKTCSIQVYNKTYQNHRTTEIKHQFGLPEINITLKSQTTQPIILRQISLNEISKIQERLNKMKIQNLEKLPDKQTDDSTYWVVVVLIIIIVIIFILILSLIIVKKYKRRPLANFIIKKSTLEEKEKELEEKQQSLLFSN